MSTSPPVDPPFQFSLKSIFWLTVAVALFCVLITVEYWPAVIAVILVICASPPLIQWIENLGRRRSR
jgi:hypothetical protein